MTGESARRDRRQDVQVVVVLDCADLDRSTAFWCGLLEYVAEPSSPGCYRQLQPADGNGFELLLQRVPETKTTKNRMHLDLRVPDLQTEVARALALGARCVTEHPIEECGWIWHVLVDPDNNEFCVLQPPSTTTRQ